MRRVCLTLLLWLLPVSVFAQANVGWTGYALNKGDTVDIVTRSSDECDMLAATVSGSALITTIITGTGCLEVGQTLTGAALTGNAGTITAVSSQQSQILPSTAATHTTTTIDGIPTNSCALISASMYVVGTTIAAQTYTTTACAGGAVTINQAATGTNPAVTDLAFTPAILSSVVADATVTCAATAAVCAPLIAGANQDVVTVSYTVQVPNRSVAGNFTHTPTTDRSATTDASDALAEGVLQSVTAQVTTGNPDRGAIYACIRVCRNSAVIATLACGFPTVNRPVAFIAGGPSTWDKPEDAGRIRTFAQSRPATGAEVRIPIPDAVTWELTGLTSLLQISTTAGKRAPLVRLIEKEGITTYGAPFAHTQPIVEQAAARNIGVTVSSGTTTEYEQRSYSPSADFSGISEPGAATQATVTKAAPGAAYRLVIESVTASLTNGGAAAAGLVVVNLRDSTTGAGNVIYTFRLALAAVQSTSATHTVPNLNLALPPNAAATWETSAAPAANVVASVSFKGHIELAEPLYRMSLPDRKLLAGGGKALIMLMGQAADDIWSEPQWSVIEYWNEF